MTPSLSDVAVLHRGEHFLVLNKPSGLPTTSPRPEATLTAYARELDREAERLHPSSRLDAEVTGVVIFARTRQATEHLLAARANHTYARGYIALGPKPPDPATGQWQGAIAIDRRDARKRTVVDSKSAGAREACSLYRTLAALERAAVLWLEPQTGRTHQLRVHAAAAGVPLLGDRHYGGAIRVTLADGSILAARRTMLHCARVQIPDPNGGATLRFEAPLPGDFATLLQGLGGSAPAFP